MTPLRFARLSTTYHDCMTAYPLNSEHILIPREVSLRYFLELELMVVTAPNN
jgi:hypothetical protein